MTVRIPTLSLAHTKTASIVDYMKEVTDEIEESGAEDGSALKAAFEAYRDSCRKKTSLYGATTREIDQNADHFWRGTRSQLKLSATHPEEETRTAALEILGSDPGSDAAQISGAIRCPRNSAAQTGGDR